MVLMVAVACWMSPSASMQLAEALTETPQIMVDQVGYLPDESKVAIFADPVKGQNSTQHYQFN